ncbi:MAG: dipicolinate synthase subunit B [Clostridium sp.]|nr:dipicolinate synthase subunit B [Clostridium sp.]MCM1208833.1 dipicolinate synthase subunit B [Ruminococcus sp.]MCM1287276.1 dipicolinate synthase subunit B [Clostridium sp.]
MKLSGCNVGFGITGSFCTFDKIKTQIKVLKDEGANVIPVYSFNAYNLDNRFTEAAKFVDEIKNITASYDIHTIQAAEPVGPKKLFDIMIIAPCTGNTAAKLCNGIVDTPVLMAAKAHMRNGRPLVISISTNDALGINFKSIGSLMVMKNIFFVPFGQDDYMTKPNSMVADVSLIRETLEEALEGRQLQPVVR